MLKVVLLKPPTPSLTDIPHTHTSQPDPSLFKYKVVQKANN